MTISTTQNQVSFTGDGVSTVFPYGFPFIATTDIKVYVDGVQQVSGFTTSGTSSSGGSGTFNSGTVTFSVAPASLATVLLYCDPDLLQSTSLPPNDPFPSKTVEKMVDKVTLLIQRLKTAFGNAITFPLGESVSGVLPDAATRADKALTFDSSGNLQLVAPASGSATDLALQLASTASASMGAGMSGFSYANNYAVGTLGGLAKTLGINPRLLPYSAPGNGTASDTTAVQAAIDANPGMPIHLSGTGWRFDTEVVYDTGSASVFAQGLQISGDGMAQTVIDNRVPNGHCFRITGSGSSEFQFGVTVRNLKITTTTSPVVSGGLSLRGIYSCLLENVWITGLSADGVKLIMSAGDADGSNMVTLRRCRLENCAGWGFNHAVTGAYNETSFLRMEHTFIQGCGTSSATVPPPSGGMRWKGQILEVQGGAFVLCQNVGLYLQGGAGLGNVVDIQNTAFENNYKRHGYCDGIDGFRSNGMQQYSNDTYQTTVGWEFVGSTYAIKNIDIRNSIVRATSGNNPHTAFKVSGANAVLNTCRVRNTSWQNFDSTGQVRFDGWQFDQIAQNCVLVALGTTSVVLRPYRDQISRGNKTPLRLRGSGSTSGEWIEHEVPYAGISISNSGLAISTVYNCYLYDNNGVAALEAVTTAYADDQPSGYTVKNGDATRLFVGRFATDGAGLILTANTGWLNPTPISGSQTGTFSWMWYSGTSAALRRTTVVLPTSDTDGALV